MHIVYLGCNGFPYGLAQVERQKLIAKSLVGAGNHVVIINRMGIHSPDDFQIKAKGNVYGIDYVYASGSPYRQSTLVRKLYFRLKGLIGEALYLCKLKFQSKADLIILSCFVFRTLRYYYCLSRLLRIKLVLDNVEFSSAMIWPKVKKNFSRFDEKAAYYTDYAICISNFLAENMQNQRPTLPIIKIPAICDLTKIDSVCKEMGNVNYFLFCGSAFYVEVIEFILHSFVLSDSDDYYLYLVVNGKASDIEKMDHLINENPKRDRIKVYSKLDYRSLICLYKQAKALLIPLRPTLQDKARFPHKIGEYTASGRPVITTNYGEMPFYFTDMENALVASDYHPEKFMQKMDFVVKNPRLSDEIGLRGKALCKAKFDYQFCGPQIIQMVNAWKS